MRRSVLLAVGVLVAVGCSDTAEVTTTMVGVAPTTSISTTTSLITTVPATTAPPSTTTTTTTTTTRPAPTTSTATVPACADLGTGGGAEVALFGIPTGTPRWSAELAAPLEAFAVAGATVALMLGDGSLVVLDASDCRERWRAPIGGPAALSTGDGVVYVVTPDLVVAREAASGNPLWSTPVDGIVPGPEPIVAGGVVLVVDEGTRLLGLDAASGDLRYEIDLPGAGGVAAGDELLYATGTAAAVATYELATGFAAWSTPLSAAGIEPTYHRGAVFVGLEDGAVAAVDAVDGELRWSVPIGGTPLGPPMVDHNEVHQLDADGRLHHLKRATGESVFVSTFDSGARPVPDARLVVEQRDGSVTAYNLLERVRWTITTGLVGFVEVRVSEGFVVAHTFAAG